MWTHYAAIMFTVFKWCIKELYLNGAEDDIDCSSIGQPTNIDHTDASVQEDISKLPCFINDTRLHLLHHVVC